MVLLLCPPPAALLSQVGDAWLAEAPHGPLLALPTEFTGLADASAKPGQGPMGDRALDAAQKMRGKS